MKNRNIFAYLFIYCFLIVLIMQNTIADCPEEPLTEGRIAIMIGNYNTALIDLYRIEAHGKFLEIKRLMAAMVCNNVVYDLNQLNKNFKLSTGMFNIHGQLESWDEALNKAKTYIDKLQNWAEVNNEITAHQRTLYEAEIAVKDMYQKLCNAIAAYNCHHPSNTIDNPKGPRELYYPPTATIYWNCFGTEYHSGDCMVVYDTPYAARDDHKAFCGGYKDPNPEVAGCGDEYYTCVDKHNKKHGSVGCTRSIKYREFSIYFGWYTYKSETCGVLFRKCTVTKGPHKYIKPYRGKPYPTAFLDEHIYTEKRRR